MPCLSASLPKARKETRRLDPFDEIEVLDDINGDIPSLWVISAICKLSNIGGFLCVRIVLFTFI